MPSLWRHHLWILLAGGVVLFTNLGGPDLWDRDEPRNAACAREMLERGDWIVPYFNHELRTHKPALLYWLMMSAYAVFGVNEFSARFWSAALGLGTIVLTYHIGRVLYRPAVGLWSALLLATALSFDISSRAATPDAVLLFCLTLTLYLFARSSAASKAAGEIALPRSWQAYAGIYAAMAFGVLAKGPVGVALPMAALGIYALFAVPLLPEKEGICDTLGARLKRLGYRFDPNRIVRIGWSMQPMMLLAMLAIIALPWYVWVGVRTDGEFLREFLGTHNFSRFSEPMENHRGPIIYYLIAICIGMFPASIWMGPALIKLSNRLRSKHEWSQGDLLLCCWAGTWIVFFSLAQTKLPSYVLPAYPAVAIILGAFAETYVTESKLLDRNWFRSAMVCLALVGVAILVGLPLAAQKLLPTETGLGLIGLIPLCGAAVCLALAERGQRRAAMVSFTLMSVLFSTTLLALAIERVDRHQVSRPMMEIVRASSGEDPARIASFKHLNSTYVYYAGQRVEEFREAAAVAAFFHDRTPAYLLVLDRDLPALRDALPEDVVEVARMPQFLKSGELILLGRGVTTAALRTARQVVFPPEKTEQKKY
jgi:4-amino-4-deoxy-L-arabinose transferase-like glycosyltransferase